VQKVREAAGRAACGNNLKQLGIGLHNYHDTYAAIPPSRLDKAGGVAWTVLMLPFIEQDNFYRRWDPSRWYYDQGQTVAEGDEIRQTQVKLYYCPTRRQPALNSTTGDKPDYSWSGVKAHYAGALGDYACCVGDNLSLDYNGNGGNGAMVVAKPPWTYTKNSNPKVIAPWKSQTRFANITDGLANTIFIGEKHVEFGKWGTNVPANLNATAGDGSTYNGDHPWVISRAAGPNNPIALTPFDKFLAQFGSYHPAVCQFTLGDGSVRALATSTSGTVLSLLAKRDDGQPVPSY
jgi:hypothetical protein